MKASTFASLTIALLLTPAAAQDQVDEGYPLVKHTTGFITRDDDEIYYESSGEGDTIVFCHGLGGNHAIWYQQVAEFARRYRVIAWDQRGFGRSTANAAEALKPATAVADLAALLDHLQVDRAHVVGQSMGGWTALGFALEHPPQVRSLVLADTIAGIYTPEIRKAFLSYVAVARANTPADGQFPLGRHPAIVRNLVDRDPAKALLYQQIGSFPSPPTTAVGSLLISTAYDLEALKKLDTPTLFIAGSGDPIFAASVIHKAAEQIPGSLVREISDSGHSPYFERPAVWNEVVAEFVRGH